MNDRKSGFTIVELLIVIVVIGILAAITIIAYNGIQNRAKGAAAQAAAAQTTKKLMAYAAENNDLFPTDLATAGITNTTDTTFQYSYSNTVPRTVCITATNNNLSYFENNTTQQNAIAGACPGHGLNGIAPTTNYAQNPSFETNQANLSDMGGAGTDSTNTRTNTWADSGAWSSQITKTLTANNPKGKKIMIDSALAAGDIVRWAVTIRNPNSTARVFAAYGERSLPTYVGMTGSSYTSIPANSIMRISGQITITSGSEGPSSSNFGFGVLPSTTFAIGESYFIDSYVITINQPLPTTFFDGSSANWVWNGTANNSTSTGPAS